MEFSSSNITEQAELNRSRMSDDEEFRDLALYFPRQKRLFQSNELFAELSDHDLSVMCTMSMIEDFTVVARLKRMLKKIKSKMASNEHPPSKNVNREIAFDSRVYSINKVCTIEEIFEIDVRIYCKYNVLDEDDDWEPELGSTFYISNASEEPKILDSAPAKFDKKRYCVC